MEAVTIRLARAEDVPGLGPLLVTLGYPASDAQITARLSRHLDGPDACLFVAEDETRLVGFAAFHRLALLHHDSALGRITSFAVSEAYQRRGVGKRLLEQIEAHARIQGCGRIEVTSAEHRQGAHQFYQSLGYQKASLRFVKTL